jgi:predicted amidohydrolase
MSPDMDLRIAGYQMPVGPDIERNTQRLSCAIDWAADHGAEILLTPEGSLSGYTPEFDARLAEQALGIVTERARDRKIGLALGTCFVEPDGKCYNQLRFYRPTGEYLGFHSKHLRCGSVDGRSEGEVEHYAVSDLRVFPWRDDLCIGGLICNDLWANPECTPMPDPHLTQQLSAMGARVILHAVNGGRNGSRWSELTWQYHEANLRMRARAAGIWIATVDSATPEHLPCSAPSGVIDRWGEFACRANPKGEQLFAYTITLDDGPRAAERDLATPAP